MAKNKTSKSVENPSQDVTVMSDESLEQVVGGANSGNGQGKGQAKGKDKKGNTPTGGINTSFGDGSVRSISDGTSNTIILGEN